MTDKLIMVPGTLFDKNLFKHQLQCLNSKAECYVANNSSSDNLEEVAKKILYKYEGKLSVLGHSYGGIIAFELFRQAPERIGKLILLNTTHKVPNKQTKILFQKFIGMAFLGEFNKITSDNLIDIMLTPENAKNNDLRDAIVNMSLNVGIDNFYNQVKAQLGRPDSTKDLKNIKCPTLIIAGREDNICPLKLHEEMAEAIPNSTLKVIDKCGHLSPLEQPVLVNNTIIDWWNKN